MRTQLYDLMRRFGKPATLATISRTVNEETGNVSVVERTWTGVIGHVPYQAFGSPPSKVAEADAWFITDQSVTEDTEIHCNHIMHRVVRLHVFDKYTIISAKGVAPRSHYGEFRDDFEQTDGMSSRVI